MPGIWRVLDVTIQKSPSSLFAAELSCLESPQTTKSVMAPIKRTIASVSEDDSEREIDSSSQDSDSSQTLSVSRVALYAMRLETH